MTAGETLVKQLEARLKQLEKRVKIAERAAKQTEARSRDALATRDAENKKTLAETGSALAERAEMIVADATRKAEAARKAEATAKETLAEQTSLLKRRHAEALEKKDAIVANVVAACKQEEAVREEAAARATKAEARARAAESALERARVDLRDAEEARRDAELAAERHERKSKTYRDENETLVLKYDRAMRRFANAEYSEHIGLGSLDDRGNRGGPRRASGKSARARAAASDSGGGGRERGGEPSRKDVADGRVSSKSLTLSVRTQHTSKRIFQSCVHVRLSRCNNDVAADTRAHGVPPAPSGGASRLARGARGASRDARALRRRVRGRIRGWRRRGVARARRRFRRSRPD